MGGVMRHKKENKIKISPRIPVTMLEVLRELSLKHGLSQNKIIERALNKEFKVLKKCEPII